MMIIPLTTVRIISFLSDLTPTERWQAAGRFSGSWMSGQWVIVSVFIALLLLLLLFAVSVFYRVTQQKKAAEILFLKQARQKGFSETELQILKAVADHCGLKNKSAILTIEGAFNHGANVAIQKAANRLSVEKSRELENHLKQLKEKLGFTSENAQFARAAAAGKGKGTRQIPAGTKVYITRRRERFDDGLESTVIENTERGLKIEPKVKVRVAPGDKWQASYAFGASIWSFESTVLEFEGIFLTLAHSDAVHFVNRKRFPAVKLRKKAAIAGYPFLETVEKRGNSQNNTRDAQTAGKAADNEVIEPIFFPAVITEVSGPWIKVETSEEIDKDQKMLVTFVLEEKGKHTGSTIKVRAFGEAKRVEKAENGFSLAIELKGCEDSRIEDFVEIVSRVSLEDLSEKQVGVETDDAEEQAVVSVT